MPCENIFSGAQGIFPTIAGSSQVQGWKSSGTIERAGLSEDNFFFKLVKHMLTLLEKSRKYQLQIINVHENWQLPSNLHTRTAS